MTKVEQVFALDAAGKTTSQIATELGMSAARVLEILEEGAPPEVGPLPTGVRQQKPAPRAELQLQRIVANDHGAGWVALAARLVRQTPRAVLVELANGHEAWIPKSLSRPLDGAIKVKVWFAEKELGLVREGPSTVEEIAAELYAG